MEIKANGINLYAEVNGSGTPLLFIHGLGSSTRDWEFQVPVFEKSYKVITFDLRGHGKSDKLPGPYTMSLFAADTAALLKALGVSNAHVVGLSLGGAVAFQLALDYPALIKTLTIVDSGPSGFPDTPEGRKEVDARAGIVRQYGMRRFPRPEHAALRATFVERWAENDPDAYLAALYAMVGWDVFSRVGEIQAPTLALAADQDYTPISSKEAFVAKMPYAELVVIPDAHHAMPTERPEAFNPALAEFLAKHNLSP